MRLLPQSTQPATPCPLFGTLGRGVLFAGVPSLSDRVLYDLGPYAKHGQPDNSPTRANYPTGRRGAVLASASSQGFTVGTDKYLSPLTALSILVYWRVGTSFGNFVTFARDDAFNGRAYVLDSQAANRMRFYVAGGGSVGTNQINDPTAQNINEDLICIATFNDATDTAKLWVNGVLVSSSTTFTGVPGNATGATTVGQRTFSGFQDYLNGAIFEAVLWNRALQDDECIALSANPWRLFAQPAPPTWFAAGAAAPVLMGQACL